MSDMGQITFSRLVRLRYLDPPLRRVSGNSIIIRQLVLVRKNVCVVHLKEFFPGVVRNCIFRECID